MRQAPAWTRRGPPWHESRRAASDPRDLPYAAGVTGIAKRLHVLADGRELIYFDDADTALPPERAADLRELPERPPTPVMRLDPLTGEWVSIAAARQHRVVMPSADLDPLAPQSPGNPSEIPSDYDVA